VSEDSLLTFPCDLPIKVFGRNSPSFRASVLAIVQAHFPDVGDADVSEHLSRAATYSSLTITVHVASKQQADDLYRQLTASPQILMVL
jgi:uncharacterized protein